MRERFQRPEVKDLETKWKMQYWDYSTGKRCKRSKVWGKSSVPTRREAQQLADRFMEKVNECNNDPKNRPSPYVTLDMLIAKCREKTWPHLKNSTIKGYEYAMGIVLPVFGSTQLRKLENEALQDFFNSLSPDLSPKSVKNIHADLRAQLSQAVVWGYLDKNPAIGVRLPRKKAKKPPVILPLEDIWRFIELLPEPTRTLVILIVIGSVRPGEGLALHWRSVHPDRIDIVERVYDGEFDEVKTEAGNRSVPFDDQGVMKGALRNIWEKSRHRQPDDLVFCTRKGTPIERRNVLRHLKQAAATLGVSKTIDFRSFRTMHASLMRRAGARPEVARDNMGHSDIPVTLNVYSKSWLDERRTAVTGVVDSLVRAKVAVAEDGPKQPVSTPFDGERWEPLSGNPEPRADGDGLVTR